MLAGKKILVVGGAGYVGGYLARFLSSRQADVYVMNRSGLPFGSPLNSCVKSVIGDTMNSNKHSHLINSMDIIIHSVGTLVDTSITKFAKPGEPGTYQQVNRDTFLNLLKVIQERKTVIYISADASPPLIPQRYIIAKQQAEEALLNSIHEGYILKPGMIYSWKAKKWTLPLQFAVRFWMYLYGLLEKNAPSFAHYLKGLKAGEPTQLKEMAETIAHVLENENVAEHVLYNDQIKRYSEEYNDLKIRKGIEEQ